MQNIWKKIFKCRFEGIECVCITFFFHCMTIAECFIIITILKRMLRIFFLCLLSEVNSHRFVDTSGKMEKIESMLKSNNCKQRNWGRKTTKSCVLHNSILSTMHIWNSVLFKRNNFGERTQNAKNSSTRREKGNSHNRHTHTHAEHWIRWI